MLKIIPIKLSLLVWIVFFVSSSVCLAELRFDSWHTFSDKLQKGSRVESAMAANPLSGIYFHLYKASAPEGGPYPYAGVSYQKQKSKPYPLGEHKVQLTYKSKGKLQLVLQQQGVAVGNGFSIDLAESADYRTINILLDDFKQPAWVKKKTSLKKHLLTAIKFQIPGSDKSDTELWVKRLRIILNESQQFSLDSHWELMDIAKNDLDVKRHENGVVVSNDELYLIGGRSSSGLKVKESLRLSLSQHQWSLVASPPVDMHHIQPILYKEKIYIVSGYGGQCCNEKTLTHIYIYDPEKDQWSIGPKIPISFQRGAAAVTLVGDELYIAGGVVGGHHNKNVVPLRKFDRYNLKKDEWKHLAEMPRTRDHFSGINVDGDLYYIGGRDSSAADNSKTIKEIDVFNLENRFWKTLPQTTDFPFPRSGAAYLYNEGKIYIIGGEGLDTVYVQTSIFDIESKQWSRGRDLLIPRHGTQAVIADGKILVAAGAINAQVDESDGVEWLPLDTN